jgi:hypothetical protein
MQRGDEVRDDEWRWCRNRERSRLNGDALGDTVPRSVLGCGGNGERININARPVRCTEGDRSEQENATPRADVEHPWTAPWEFAESAGGAPPLKADQREACCWVEPRAERLAWINRDHRVAGGGDMFAPRRAHHNAAHAQDRKLGAPARRPLFGGDRSHEKWANPAQADTTSREGGEAFEFRY